MIRHCRIRPLTTAAAVVALTWAMLGSVGLAQDTGGLRDRPGRRPIKLWPPATTQPAEGESIGRPIDLGGWSYRAVKAADPRDGVPWELIVTPTGHNAELWRPGPIEALTAPTLTATARQADDRAKQKETIPVVQVPEQVWPQWMDGVLKEAVGIHFHQFVTDDVARILYTVHKVPADGPDGKPPASYRGRGGTRIEATLLTPVVFSLDQSIAVRKERLDPAAAPRRAEHELGHALESQAVFLDVLRGPQDWKPEYCIGRRSQVTYYWRKERIGRSWDDYQRGVGKLLTLRTSVVLLPPTRWSLLLPIPPERVTRKHLEAFNAAIVHPAEAFAEADRRAQDAYHAKHGAFEAGKP